MVGGGDQRAPGSLVKCSLRVQVSMSTCPSGLPTFVIMNTKSWFLDIPSRMVGDRVIGSGHPVYVTGEIGINHNGDLANALALIDQAATAGCDAVKFQKRTPRDLHPARSVGPRAGHPVGPDALHRLPAPGRVRRRRVRDHRRARPPSRHRLVRLAVGRRVGRLPRAVRRAGPQGGLGLPDRRRAAAAAAGHRPAHHPVHRHVHDAADPARRRGAGQRQHRALPRHQHLSRRRPPSSTCG